MPAVFGRHKRAGDLPRCEKTRQPGNTEPCETFNVIVGAAMACRGCRNLPDALAAMSKGNRDPDAGQQKQHGKQGGADEPFVRQSGHDARPLAELAMTRAGQFLDGVVHLS